MLLYQSYSLKIIGHGRPSEAESTLYTVLVPGLADPVVISTYHFLEIPRGRPDSDFRMLLTSF